MALRITIDDSFEEKTINFMSYINDNMELEITLGVFNGDSPIIDVWARADVSKRVWPNGCLIELEQFYNNVLGGVKYSFKSDGKINNQNLVDTIIKNIFPLEVFKLFIRTEGNTICSMDFDRDVAHSPTGLLDV